MLGLILTFIALVILVFLASNKFFKIKTNQLEIKDVLLNPEELEYHAKEISKVHTVSGKKTSAKFLLSRLNSNFRLISSVYKSLINDAKKKKNLSPASEWLLDNFYKIEEQVKVIRQNLRNDNLLELNILNSGFLKGYPRVYAVALELVSHTDGRLDENVLINFIKSYQTQSILSIAEVWALSLMIRMALIENIRNICEKIYETQVEWEKVDKLSSKDPDELLNLIKENIEKTDRVNPSYVEYLLRKLRREEVESSEIISCLEKKLLEFNTTIEKVINEEHKEQAARKISIENAITSLNVVSTIDWNDIFESLCFVNKILREDPLKIYSKMDFESRDYYRKQIEKIAKQYRVSEINVARKAIECAQKASGNGFQDKSKHVGYYIIDKGRRELLTELGYKGKDYFHNYPTYFYLAPVFVLTALICSFFIAYSYLYSGERNIFLSILVGIVVLIPASDISVTTVNWIFTHMFPPAFLPKLEYRNGIPEDASTMVAIPTLLPNEKKVKELIDQIEVCYLANREKNLYFALVGDYKDAQTKNVSIDEKINKAAIEGIKKLNKKYAENQDIFYYFHRHRQYCEKQGKWMGWERKRGALIELNQLLTGSKETSYSIISGDISNLKDLKYVITLDADTNLPFDTAKKLIGAISHPLNKAVLDEDKGIVTEGYGLIQPRIGVDIESANKSLFTRIFAGQGGIDPYTAAISDVYQDLFGEGIFTGKGIYDLHIFNKVLKDAIPDNSVLSHDLLEGSYVRAGLATDIELIDGYPSKYSSYIMRLHRWVRGDWQLIKWLSSRIKNRKGQSIKNPLSALSKWKIFDNLRRSLVSISIMLLFFFGLTVFPGNVFVWLGFAFLAICFPLITGFADYIVLKSYKIREKLNGNLICGLKATLYQAVLLFVFLPYQAFMMTDAIFRTLYRVYISKRNLLEWVTAADVEKNLKNDLKSYFKRMKAAMLIAVATFMFVFFIKPVNLIYTLPLAAIWVFSPLIAYYVSKDEDKTLEMLNEEDITELRRIARKTWAFYEDFAGAKENYLPPDNFQENPPNGITHRTSPTNIGFLLISTLAARDLGYLSTTQMFERIEKTVSTIEKMETWKGHLFNWYDTRTLEVLRPFFVSSVDSGNFIGYLITLKQGILEYLEKPIFDINLVKGLKDTILLIEKESISDISDLDKLIERGSPTLSDWKNLINTLSSKEYGESVWEKKLVDMICWLKNEIDKIFLDVDIEKHPEFLNNDVYIKLKIIMENIKSDISLVDLKYTYEKMMIEIDNILKIVKDKEEESRYLLSLRNDLKILKKNVESIINSFKDLIHRIDKLIKDTDFTPLYDHKRHLFSIGYNVEDEKLINSYYDLFASEARIVSYIAITRREVPKKHWDKLGRALTISEGYRSLVSWAGTMFEYLMPALVMRNYKNTLLDETYYTVIKAQMRYGDKRNVPWGTSESGYYAFDMMLNYQYKAFGVPDLGLKRGLIEDMVVSPYSTVLALPFEPKKAMENIKRLVSDGIEGNYGFYEAVDYTPERLPAGKRRALVQSFMAHHQGMILISLNNYLNENIMQKRFHSDPFIKAGETLLQEKVPLKAIITKEYKEDVEPLEEIEKEDIKVVRKFGIPDSSIPNCHLISNGRYSVMITNGGSGYSKKEDIQITRWREDSLTGRYGTFIFLRNLSSNTVWSATYDPIHKEPDGYKAVFSLHKAKFMRTDDNIDTHTEIVVSPEDDVEIRKVTLTNHGNKAAVIELTSYLEIVISSHAADIAHPAFNNLFVRTEVIPECDSLIASRRPRDQKQATVWSFHTITVEGETVGNLQYETNRCNFIGRGRNISNPAALTQPLTNTTGIVLDPIMSLRRRVKVEPGEKVTISYITGIASSRDETLELSKKYYDGSSIHRAFELALTRSQVETVYLNLKTDEIETYQDLISHILFLSPLRRKNKELLKRNTKGQTGLWPYGISGDLPIVLISIKHANGIDRVRELLKAHEYWKTKGLLVDLVILNEDESSYLQPLQELLKEIVFTNYGKYFQDSPGGVYIRNASVMPEEDIILLYTAARIVLCAEAGPISSQINLKDEQRFSKVKEFKRNNIEYIGKDEPLELDFFNGYGGFYDGGKEYVIRLKEDMCTPAPWINVVSNESFGFQVSESGSGFTWAENSRENKLTPWSNDPVSDPPGEVIYLRDEEDGSLWSVTPLPIREKESYTIKHGFGYTIFQHNSHGIEQELTMFVPKDDPVKINLISLKNNSGVKRRLTLTYYMRPVMGVTDQFTQQYVTTEFEQTTGTFLIKNSYNSDFPGRIAFIASSEDIKSYTGDRYEFIGRNRDLRSPEALKREFLSNTTGAGLDPCASIQIEIELTPGQKKELTFLLGQTKKPREIHQIVDKYIKLKNCKKALEEIKEHWKKILETVQVKTPDLTMDLMINNWLLYQTISCRLWARSAFYQSGGAFGFRDQLQDAMNSINALPDATRKQILLHSAHQFVEGDVQHWWHPGAGDKGIRTKFSDDLLWLPLAVSEYVYNTGDYEILNEKVNYLEDKPLGEDEDERYGTPRISDEKGPVYDHCIRAIERSLKFGEHGIPLMGSGDWNDGMNNVGNKGKGESIWLGWFIYAILKRFAPICKKMNELERAERYIETANRIAEAIETNAWDGSWYKRAYFDDGTPLGSAENTECTIDSLAQSWAVISKAGRSDRIKEAMKSVEQYLVKREEGLILLFTPPFDESELNPGYIKGYVPGVRENGGQYTHAATWVIAAFAMMGDGDKAWELYHLINPINHTRSTIECAKYKVEPYVMAADVYAVNPHVGRGGWTWYTGAAGWMYKVGIEYILGLKKNGEKLIIDPCIPKNWPEYLIKYRYKNTRYNIKIKNPEGVNRHVKEMNLDGKLLEEKYISLINDSKDHDVEVILG